MTSKYTKQKLIKLKEEIDKSIIIIGNFNANFPLVDRTDKKKNQ